LNPGYNYTARSNQSTPGNKIIQNLSMTGFREMDI